MFASDLSGALFFTLAACFWIRSFACLAAFTAAAADAFMIVEPNWPSKLSAELLFVDAVLSPNRRPMVVLSAPVAFDWDARHACDCCQNDGVLTKNDIGSDSEPESRGPVVNETLA